MNNLIWRVKEKCAGVWDRRLSKICVSIKKTWDIKKILNVIPVRQKPTVILTTSGEPTPTGNPMTTKGPNPTGNPNITAEHLQTLHEVHLFYFEVHNKLEMTNLYIMC